MWAVKLTLGNTTTHVCHNILLINLSLDQTGGGDGTTAASAAVVVAARRRGGHSSDLPHGADQGGAWPGGLLGVGTLAPRP